MDRPRFLGSASNHKWIRRAKFLKMHSSSCIKLLKIWWPKVHLWMTSTAFSNKTQIKGSEICFKPTIPSVMVGFKKLVTRITSCHQNIPSTSSIEDAMDSISLHTPLVYQEKNVKKYWLTKLFLHPLAFTMWNSIWLTPITKLHVWFQMAQVQKGILVLTTTRQIPYSGYPTLVIWKTIRYLCTTRRNYAANAKRRWVMVTMITHLTEVSL